MDITMCSSITCPIRADCLRTRTASNKINQSWIDFGYTCNENSGFANYIARISRKNENIIKANSRMP